MKSSILFKGDPLLFFKSNLKITFLICVFTFSVLQAYANPDSKTSVGEKVKQEIITGTVSDVNGPIPGVNIQIKGTSIGTVSDFDGKFSITASIDNPVLIFSYIGYTTKEVNLKCHFRRRCRET